MKKHVASVAVVVVSAGLVAAYAASATASSDDTRVKKFCNKALQVDLQVGTVPGLTSSNLTELATDTKKGFNKLVKLAPTKPVRKVLVKYYAEIAEVGDLEQIEYSAERMAAVETLKGYATTTCTPLLTPDN
jgi:hypothetical protein